MMTIAFIIAAVVIGVILGIWLSAFLLYRGLRDSIVRGLNW